MRYQIRFQKTGLGLIPVMEGANGNLLLEQGAGLGRGKPANNDLAMWA